MNLIDHAHDYHLAGFNPIPLRVDKSPALPSGENYLHSFVSTEWIDTHFTRAEKIGVACGEVSGNLICIDFDMHNEGENVHQVFDLFTQTPQVAHLIKTNQVAVYSTPSGGRHIIYRTPETEPSKKLARYESGTIMIETKGQGGYIACYPSQGYTHLGGCDLIEVGELDDEAHLYLIELAISFTEREFTEAAQSGKKDGAKWGEKWDVNTPEGRYNLQEGKAAFELLIDAGWQVNTLRPARPGITNLTRPGKRLEDGISATWGFQKNMFYVFTESSEDFPLPAQQLGDPAGKGFSPFEILVRLEYGGDWRKAKDALRELYGMKPKAALKPIEIEQKDVVKLTPFPIEVLPKDFQTYILTLSKAFNYSADITACSMMYTVATIIGNKVKLRVKNGWETPMIFWFAVLGNPGTLKSHPVNTVLKAIKKIDIDNKRIFDEMINEYNMLEDKEKKGAKKPYFHQTIISDYTMEALHMVHNYNKRGIGLHKDELIGFMNDMNKYREGSDEQFWLESFNNSDHVINRVSRDPIMIEKIMINIIGTIQPSVLTRMIEKNKGTGLVDRFLYTRPETVVHTITDKEVDSKVFEWWENYIAEINTNSQYIDLEDTIFANMTPQGFKKYQEIDAKYVKIQNDHNEEENVRSYLSKIKTYIPRFALFLSFCDHVDPNTAQPSLDVDLHHVERAEKIADYFLNTAKHVFVDSEQRQEYGEILLTLKGKTTKEKVIALNERGLTNKIIAEILQKTPGRISQILKDA